MPLFQYLREEKGNVALEAGSQISRWWKPFWSAFYIIMTKWLLYIVLTDTKKSSVKNSNIFAFDMRFYILSSAMLSLLSQDSIFPLSSMCCCFPKSITFPKNIESRRTTLHAAHLKLKVSLSLSPFLGTCFMLKVKLKATRQTARLASRHGVA